MVEPQDTLTDPAVQAVRFVRRAGTVREDGRPDYQWIGYSATTDPMDLIVYCPTHAARDFSIRRVDRLHRHSKTVGEAVLKAKDADNRTDKQYTNGMMLTLEPSERKTSLPVSLSGAWA
jgi:phage terminase large subunit GpA-like protein